MVSKLLCRDLLANLTNNNFSSTKFLPRWFTIESCVRKIETYGKILFDEFLATYLKYDENSNIISGFFQKQKVMNACSKEHLLANVCSISANSSEVEVAWLWNLKKLEKREIRKQMAGNINSRSQNWPIWGIALFQKEIKFLVFHMCSCVIFSHNEHLKKFSLSIGCVTLGANSSSYLNNSIVVQSNKIRASIITICLLIC